MGLERAKSLLPLRDGLTFLDLILRQIDYLRRAGSGDPAFVLMNSFSTSEDTMAHLAGKHAVGVRALRGACRHDRESIAGLTRRRRRKVEESADPPELDARGVIADINSACRSCQHDSLG
jgi:hypothetical protein